MDDGFENGLIKVFVVTLTLDRRARRHENLDDTVYRSVEVSFQNKIDQNIDQNVPKVFLAFC